MPDADSAAEILSQESFTRTLLLERKRTERSHRPFILMLLEGAALLKNHQGDALGRIARALCHSTRDTDAKGWYREGSSIGVIFTEIGATGRERSVAGALTKKLRSALSLALGEEAAGQLHLSYHIFPEEERLGPGRAVDSVLYPEVAGGSRRAKAARAGKRAMDILGSLLAVLVLSPLFLAIAIAVKLTSKGPVLFSAERIGQYGKGFPFLKFRSMQVANDDRIHREFVAGLITGKAAAGQAENGLYKMTADPRVTPVGRFLRRTSLDELPQFFNVLQGHMSLVGPRPPLPYEVRHYDIWHNARLLAVKPGITGLWQVKGRSRVKFDDMVRMDLEYARSWSLWLDLKILFDTPRAVVTGSGAC